MIPQSNSNRNRMTAHISNQRGMTLIEIMIVIAIIAGLMAVLGTQANSFLQKSRVENAKIAIQELGKALEAYNLNCSQYPTTDQGLNALMTNPGPEACANWGPEPYVKKQPKDPWGTPFIYESDGSTFVLKSLGRDKKPEGTDFGKDISSEEI